MRITRSEILDLTGVNKNAPVFTILFFDDVPKSRSKYVNIDGKRFEYTVMHDVNKPHIAIKGRHTFASDVALFI